MFRRYNRRGGGSQSELKSSLVDYLEKHPEAKDTIVGIARWWVFEKPDQVEAVLQELVEKGLIEKKNFSSLVLYSLGLAFKKGKKQSGQPIWQRSTKEGGVMSKEKILVVDDEEVLRSLAKEVLSEEGYQVTLASSGDQALEYLEQETFDLIITDLKMPGMDGMELLKKIKEQNKEAQVILLTSHLSPKTALTTLEAGAYWYLTKPLDDISVFVEKVKLALLDKKRKRIGPWGRS